MTLTLEHDPVHLAQVLDCAEPKLPHQFIVRSASRWRLDPLLATLHAGGYQFALIADEYGRTAGAVSPRGRRGGDRRSDRRRGIR